MSKDIETSYKKTRSKNREDNNGDYVSIVMIGSYEMRMTNMEKNMGDIQQNSTNEVALNVK